MLSFEGNQFLGTNAIIEKLAVRHITSPTFSVHGIFNVLYILTFFQFALLCSHGNITEHALPQGGSSNRDYRLAADTRGHHGER